MHQREKFLHPPQQAFIHKKQWTMEPPCYWPNNGTPDQQVLWELSLYVYRWLGENQFIRILGTSLRNTVYKLHMHSNRNTQIGEVVEPFMAKTGYMGTIVMQMDEGLRIIPPDGMDLANPPPTPPVPPALTNNFNSSKIKITRPPRFTGDKKNWKGFLLAADTYLAAYTNEFQDNEQKIWFIISYLGTEDGLLCVASDWLRNWKEEHMYGGLLHIGTYDDFLVKLKGAFKDPNLKINAANKLQHL